VLRDAEGAVACEHDRRLELEEQLERQEGGTWLGQFVTGEWQIRPRYVTKALAHVLSRLVALGLVNEISPALSGKHAPTYMIANRYVRGEEFAVQRRLERRKQLAEKPEPEEEEEDLADIEIERRRNMERNKELLRQLGLA